MPRGNLSKKEITFIKENIIQDDKWIGEKLGRVPEFIGKFRKKLIEAEDKQNKIDNFNSPEYDLQSRPFWTELKKQFLEEELSLVEYYWKNLITQFSNDVTPTEEMQIVDIITLQILSGRNLEERKKAVNELARLEETVTEIYEGADLSDNAVVSKINSLEIQLASGRQSQQSRTNEYKNLLEKKQQLLREMKATRDQRYKDVKETRDTFFTWLQAHDEEHRRKNESHEMALAKLGMEKEYERLSQPHIYLDGVIDLPILSAETLEMNDKIKEGE